MTILSDVEIEELCLNGDMIVPYVPESIKYVQAKTAFPSADSYSPMHTEDEQYKNRTKLYTGGFADDEMRLVKNHPVMSYGVSNHGYDVRLDDKSFMIFSNHLGTMIDPKYKMDDNLIEAKIHQGLFPEEKFVILPPHSYGLGSTVEYFKIPNDVQIICVGKSTYARSGIGINVTPIEAGFHGNVVIEIANTTPLPARVYLNEGIAQFLFFRGKACRQSYADRKGKYQGQTGIQLPKV